MGWFKKSEDVVDLSERYRRQQERLNQLKGEVNTLKNSKTLQEKPPTFFQGLVNAAQEQSKQQAEENEYADLGDGIEARRMKLTKRLMEMTSKMEELSNQIYHLTQRIELIERKMNIQSG